MRRLSIIWLVLFHCSLSIAQTGTKYQVWRYNTDNGLPSNGIKGLQWDEHAGFLWIATEAGIARFNGIDFRNFTINNTPEITSERMTFLVKNYAGKIFGADQSGNLFYTRDNQFIFYQKGKSSQHPFAAQVFLIGVSENLYNDPTPYKITHSFNLLTSTIIPMSDTDCYIAHGSGIFYLKRHMTNAVSIGQGTIRSITGFRLRDQCFVLDSSFSILAIDKSWPNPKEVALVNEDGTIFKELSTGGRLTWKEGMENPVVIRGNSAWILTYDGSKIIASAICDQIPTDAFITYVQFSLGKKILFLGTDS